MDGIIAVDELAAEALRYHQDKIAEKLTDQEILLEKALDKLDAGLDAMKEKYAEDRMLRMKNQ